MTITDKQKNASGTQIRAARLAENPPATQQNLSARLELYDVVLSASSIGKIENGTRPVTDLQLIAFAKALKVKPEWLLQRQEHI